MTKYKRDSQFIKLVVIFGIIILPLVYSLFYLKGVWDPYNKLDSIPVALVNSDVCENDCQSDRLIDTLIDENVFDFDLVDKDVALDGLVNKEYYAVIEIPEDFSSSLNSVDSNDRKQVTINFSSNTKTNYLASQIISTAVSQIESELQSEINQNIVFSLTDNLNQVPTQTALIGDALVSISDGADKLSDGSFSLKDGTSNLSTSYKTFDSGVYKLSLGASSLYDVYGDLDSGIISAYEGASELKSKTEGLSSLVSSVNDLKSGSDSFTSGLNDYKAKSDTMYDNTASAYEAIIYYCSYSDCLSDPYLSAAYQVAFGYMSSDESGYNAIEKLKAGTDSLVTANDQINGGLEMLVNGTSGLGDLKTGIDSLQSGLESLKDGSNKVYSGISDLNDGLSSLNDSSTLINNGIDSVSDGASSLSSFSGELSDGAEKAKNATLDKVSSISSDVSALDGLDDYAKDSVVVNEDDYGQVKDYGTFFSPYFMSLSLWVGGILILMGLYYDPDQRFKILGRNSESRGKRLIYYNIISVVQAVILGWLLKLFLGFEVTNIFLYYGSCILISGSFLAIIMFLFFNFKDVGKFLSLVLLVSQLAACGGTFPIQTEPTIYQLVYPYMPMTYSVDLLRESFVSINSEFLVKDVVVLIGLFVLFNGLIFFTSMFKSKKEKAKNE